MHIRIGSRSSKLAMWQSEQIQEQLEAAGISSEIIPIETKGDKILDKTLSKIGDKGLFTQELEEMLHSGAVDIAVHSAKDLPSSLEKGMEIIAFGKRESPHDVLVQVSAAQTLSELAPGAIIGTSSTRRVAFLKHYYPHLKSKNVRGNLQTRMAKLESGEYDGLILAYAGVHRMGFDAHISEKLDLGIFTPAVGQGSIAVESSQNLALDKKKQLQEVLNHTDTALCLQAERAFLSSLEGGCSIPVFALAQLESEVIHMKGGVLSLDGQKKLYHEASGLKAEAEAIGKNLAQQLLESGAGELLKEIRRELEANLS